ncbi:MAG: T9SS type A sorting domain-containing protein [Bacteroidota bacterium]
MFLCFIVLLITKLSFSQWTQLGSDINGEHNYDRSGHSVSLSSDGTVVAIGAYGNDDSGNDAGHVRVFKYTSGIWQQIGSDIDGEAAMDNSGWSVSISSDGTVVAIGAIMSDGNDSLDTDRGHVRVYEYNGFEWTQRGDDIDGEGVDDFSGEAVSLNADGAVVVIGAPGNCNVNGSSAGQARVYQYSGGNWVQKGSDIDGEAANDNSGQSVSLNDSGSIVAVGTRYNDGNGDCAGHVRVFKYGDLDWEQMGNDIDGDAVWDNLGVSVSLSSDGKIMAVGAELNDGSAWNAGQVKIFEYMDALGDWVQMGNDILGEASYDYFGHSVSLSSNGMIVAVGADASDGSYIDAGQVRIFGYDGSDWQQIGYDINGEAAADHFGRSVSISADGSVVAIGAYMSDGGILGAGQARVFNNCTGSNDSLVVNITECDSYISPSGSYVWTTSGTFLDTIPNIAGCDSVITVNLTINNTDSVIYPVTCGSYISPSGNYTWTSSGTYSDTIPNTVGCDSILTVNLTVTDIDTSVSQFGNTLYANASNASYQWVDCDNSFAMIPGETNQSFTPSSDGNYAVIINQNNCTDISPCYTITFIRINKQISHNDFSVFPVPTSGKITVTGKGIQKIDVFDFTGKHMPGFEHLPVTNEYDLGKLAKGIYLIKISTGKGVVVEKVVVE